MNKLKPIEIALIFGVVISMLAGRGIAAQQEELADCMIRLHVVANSDSEEDQAEKLAVRDAVLELAAKYGEEVRSVSEMEQLLHRYIPELEEAGNQILKERGSPHSLRAAVADCYFPTKVYDGFALPAGEYTALRVVIGNGEGENWWCVAFPPLCVGACAEHIEQAIDAGLFTPQQGGLITGEGPQYILKFRCMELLGQLKQYLRRG